MSPCKANAAAKKTSQLKAKRSGFNSGEGLLMLPPSSQVAVCILYMYSRLHPEGVAYLTGVGLAGVAAPSSTA